MCATVASRLAGLESNPSVILVDIVDEDEHILLN